MTTMYVDIDGKIEERQIVGFDTHEQGICFNRVRRGPAQAQPFLFENERAVWRVGSSIPLIIKTPEPPPTQPSMEREWPDCQ